MKKSIDNYMLNIKSNIPAIYVKYWCERTTFMWGRISVSRLDSNVIIDMSI